jgi:hypothetical protein
LLARATANPPHYPALYVSELAIVSDNVNAVFQAGSKDIFAGKIYWWCLIGLAAGLRIAIAVNDPLWLDERHTLWAQAGGFGEIATRAAAGNQFPVYYWLNYLVASPTPEANTAAPGPTAADSDNAFALPSNTSVSPWRPRALSIFCGTALIATSLCVVRKFTRCGFVATMVVLLLATDTSLLFLSTEARPYALVQLLAIWQVLSLLVAIHATNIEWASRQYLNPNTLLPSELTSNPDGSVAVSQSLASTQFNGLRLIWAKTKKSANVWTLVTIALTVLGLASHPIMMILIAAEIVLLVGCLVAWSCGWYRWLAASRGIVLLGCLAISLIAAWGYLRLASPAWDHRQLWSQVTEPVTFILFFANESGLCLLSIGLLGVYYGSRSRRETNGTVQPTIPIACVWGCWLLGLFILSFLGILIAESVGFVALSLPRYLSWAQVFPLLAAALLAGQLSQKNRWLCRLVPIGCVALLLVIGGDLAPILSRQFKAVADDSAVDGEPTQTAMIPLRHDWFAGLIRLQAVLPLRYENWQQVETVWLSQPQPTTMFMVSNILEDSLLEGQATGQPNATQQTSGVALAEYLKFPLAGRSPQFNQQLVPLPTFAEQRWQAQHWDRLRSSAATLCVVRGTADLYHEVLADLEAFVVGQGGVLRCESLDHQLGPGDLWLFRFTIGAPRESAVD